MLIDTIIAFPSFADATDNPDTGVWQGTGVISLNKITGTGFLDLCNSEGDDKRQILPYFDIIFITDDNGNSFLREIDHVVSDEILILKEPCPANVNCSFNALKRTRLNDAKVYPETISDPISIVMLNENNYTDVYNPSGINIPKDKNGQCIPFVVDGSTKKATAQTSPSI